MSWTDRLRRLALGDPQRALVGELRTLHQGSADRAERFAAYAAQAPTPGAERQLQQLASGEAALTKALAQALADRGAPAVATPAQLLNGATPNHWARLVAAMDHCRDAHDQLVRSTANLVALDPSVAGLLDALSRNLGTEIAALRELVARADPHALN